MSPSDSRYHGWRWGNSKEDQVSYQVYVRFQNEHLDFASYVKNLIYQAETGQLPTLDQVLIKVSEIERLIKSGQFVVSTQSESENGEHDQDLVNNIFDLPI